MTSQAEHAFPFSVNRQPKTSHMNQLRFTSRRNPILTSSIRRYDGKDPVIGLVSLRVQTVGKLLKHVTVNK